MTVYEVIERVRTSEEPETFTIYDGGTVLNITGATAVLTVNDAEDGSGTDQITINGVLTDPANGVVQFTPSTAQAALAAGTYFFDIKLTLSSVPSFPARGKWIVLPNIT